MYEKDKKTRITLRLNEELMNFVLSDSEMLGVTPSEYIRMLLSSCMSMSKTMGNSISKLKGEVSRENDTSTNNN